MKTIEERFWSKVIKSNGCWIWIASRHRQGYGEFGFKGKVRGSHRVSYELAHGPIPRGISILHHCDNPPCVRPSHLFAGTQADNMADRDRKGRRQALKGMENGRAKLTDSKVREIRRKYKRVIYSIPMLSREYKLSISHIHRLVTREVWRHIK